MAEFCLGTRLGWSLAARNPPLGPWARDEPPGPANLIRRLPDRAVADVEKWYQISNEAIRGPLGGAHQENGPPVCRAGNLFLLISLCPKKWIKKCLPFWCPCRLCVNSRFISWDSLNSWAPIMRWKGGDFSFLLCSQKRQKQVKSVGLDFANYKDKETLYNRLALQSMTSYIL